jgi:hypothetical protein
MEQSHASHGFVDGRDAMLRKLRHACGVGARHVLNGYSGLSDHEVTLSRQ